VSLTYLFSAEVTPRRYILSISEKTARYIELTSIDRYKEIGYGLPKDTKMCPQNFSASFGGRKR